MNELFPVEIIGADAMRAFGKEMGKHLKSGDVVALIGDLGAGKTHLAQGIALSKGFTGDVTSPTFALVNEYLAGDSGELDIFHLDIYRLENADELLQIGWEDYLDREGVIIIEWADKFPELMPKGAWCVGIEHMTGVKGRKLVCERLE